MSTISPFKGIENKQDVYRGNDCMKKFCISSKEHTMKIINFEKTKMKLLKIKQKELYENFKICYICKENFEYKHFKDKKYCKIRDHCHYTVEYGPTQPEYIVTTFSSPYQRCCRYLSSEIPNNVSVERCPDVSGVRPQDVIKERRDNVSRVRNSSIQIESIRTFFPLGIFGLGSIRRF